MSCMRDRNSILLRGILCLCATLGLLCGCNSDSDSDGDTQSTYEERTSRYTVFTVEGLWEALAEETEDNGSYILLKGVLLSVNDEAVIMIDADSDKTVTCSFSSDVDLSALETVLTNTGSDSSDTVTIGGICHFYTEGSSYPYLDQCDYYYVNKDG